LVNSRLGRFTATPSRSTGMPFHASGALLLPKLRSQFAEFLNEGSLVHLSILYLPTCVGLRYGHSRLSLEVFLGSSGPTHLASPKVRLTFTSRSLARWDLPHRPPYWFRRWLSHRWVCLSASPHHSNEPLWYRNIDLLSIAYASRPRLRPDSPAADQHGCGTLRYSVGRIHTALALLIPAFALDAAPAVLPLDLLR
jgi:hypothetical protein